MSGRPDGIGFAGNFVAQDTVEKTKTALWDAPSHVERRLDAARACVPGWHPGLREVWWWLGVPLASAAALITVHALYPDFYLNWVLPEGYGFLEVLHFLEPGAGFLIAVWLLCQPLVREWTALHRLLLLAAIACVYIAGEEMSWGQHWFRWGTPEYWSEINRQDETNLHNTNYVFNQLPQLILEIGILAGGIVAPLLDRIFGIFRRGLLAVVLPPLELMPVALLAFATKGLSTLQKSDVGTGLLTRPSETMELYYFMFILFYLVVLARRIILLQELRNQDQGS